MWSPMSPKTGDMGHPGLWWKLVQKDSSGKDVVSHVSKGGRNGRHGIVVEAA
jgi:hypothetical protein